jgi:hypothetical protein
MHRNGNKFLTNIGRQIKGEKVVFSANGTERIEHHVKKSTQIQILHLILKQLNRSHRSRGKNVII